MQVELSIIKSTNVFHHINILNKSTIFSTHMKKVFDKIEYSFMTKTLNKEERELPQPD